MAHSEKQAAGASRSTKPMHGTDPLKTFTQGSDAFVEVQKQWVDAFERLNREQLARAKQETELATELADKLTGARSLPDVMTAYQDWISRHMALFVEDGRRAFDESQKIANATMRALSGGAGMTT